MAADWAGEYPSVAKPVPSGALGRAAGRLALGESFSLLLRVAPWLPREAPQVVLALAGKNRSLVLSVTTAGFVVEVVQDGTKARCATTAAPQRRSWYEIAVTVGSGRLTLTQRPLQQVWGATDTGAAEAALPVADWSGETGITFAAAPDATAHFNGRIEDPLLLRGTPRVTLDDPAALLASGRVLAWWDFGEAMQGERCRSRPGRAARHAGQPAGAGGERLPLDRRGDDWRHAPRHYAAIHFHEDDLYDCGWETDFDVDDPGRHGERRLRRAAALRRRARTSSRSTCCRRPASRRAPIAFLASTFTYQIYGNHRRGNARRGVPRAAGRMGRLSVERATEHPEYGASTYNAHADGSGICYSTQRRPLLTMRPGFITYLDRARLGAAALPGRHPPDRLAGGQGHRLRRHHRP